LPLTFAQRTFRLPTGGGIAIHPDDELPSIDVDQAREVFDVEYRPVFPAMMPRALKSMFYPEFRDPAIAAVERGEHSLRQRGPIFAVSLAFVVRLLQRHRRPGSLPPLPPPGALRAAKPLARCSQRKRARPT